MKLQPKGAKYCRWAGVLGCLGLLVGWTARLRQYSDVRGVLT